MPVPVAGRDYPRSVGEFRTWFGSDDDCLDYLAWLRWGDAFTCDACGEHGGWSLGDGRWECRSCSYRSSVTAGTLFHRTRTPLTVWFHACWLFATEKDGVSAASLQRMVEIGSYQTAWMMLHRLRAVVVRPGRERLQGVVEVDETYVGGFEKGLSGGRARGKKVLVAIAVEIRESGCLGRCRLQVVPDASTSALTGFVKDVVEPGSRVITDGWRSYAPLARMGYEHEARSQNDARRRGEDPHALLRGVHRVASLVKRWLLSTHQGSVTLEHLQRYLDAYVFRFSRRTSRSRGMLFYRLLELAVGHNPVAYRDVIVGQASKLVPPSPPQTR